MAFLSDVFITPRTRLAPWAACMLLVIAHLCAGQAQANWVDINVLGNPGFEGNYNESWQGDYGEGSWYPPGPFEGWNFYYPGSTDWSTIYQDIDLTLVDSYHGALDPQRLETGGYFAAYGGYHASYPEVWPSADDWGRISLTMYSDRGSWGDDLGWHAPRSWTHVGAEVRIPAGTDRVRYQFDAERRDMWGGNNDAYLDNVWLEISEYDIWTWSFLYTPHLAANGDVTISEAIDIGEPLALTIDGKIYFDGGLRLAGPVVLTTTAQVTVGMWADYYPDTQNGTVIISEGSWVAQGPVGVGSRYWGPGGIRIDGGSWHSQQQVSLGSQATGRVTMTGGEWVSQAEVLMGGTWHEGIVDLQAGQWRSNGLVRLGNGANGTGTVNLHGGAWTADGSSLSDKVAVLVGDKGRGVVNIDDGGAWHTTGVVNVGMAAGSAGEVHVNDGTWQATGEINIGGPMGLGAGELTIGAGGILNLNDAVLAIGDYGTLGLAGGRILGSGEIVIHRDGYQIALGSGDTRGMINGSAASDQLLVHGDIHGSGVLANLSVIGEVSVTDQMILSNVHLTGGLLLDIFGPAPDQFARALLGAGTDFADGWITITMADFPFVPTDTFDLFDPLEGTDLDTILSAATIHTPADWRLDITTGQLGYIPESASMVILAVGSLGILRRSRCRRSLGNVT